MNGHFTTKFSISLSSKHNKNICPHFLSAAVTKPGNNEIDC